MLINVLMLNSIRLDFLNLQYDLKLQKLVILTFRHNVLLFLKNSCTRASIGLVLTIKSSANYIGTYFNAVGYFILVSRFSRQ